jgi:uncharacterized membrane protein YdjX (TVP38/TMEM64 family)
MVNRHRVALIVFALIIVALVLAGREGAALVPRFAAWVDGLGAVGVVAFIAGYALAAVALVPGSLLTLAGGAIFGLGRGIAIVFAGALLGSTAAFLVARYAARDVIATRLANGGGVARLLDAIDRAASERGFLVVLLLRLSPIFPFNVLNYALGLTGVRVRDYVGASIGMLPGTFLYVYYGRVAGDVAAAAAGVTPDRGAGHWLVLGLGLVATLTVTVLVTRVARRALQQTISVSRKETDAT